MKNRFLFALWGVLWILCGLLGLMAEPVEGFRIFIRLAALGCFLPPVLLLRSKDARTVRLIRNLAAASLGLTALLLGLNFASLGASEAVGTLLHVALSVLSSPMLCGGNWLISLFLWACLLIAAGKELKR